MYDKPKVEKLLFYQEDVMMKTICCYHLYEKTVRGTIYVVHVWLCINFQTKNDRIES